MYCKVVRGKASQRRWINPLNKFLRGRVLGWVSAALNSLSKGSEDRST